MEKINYPYTIKTPAYLGRAVKDVRKRKEMTQRALADITGTSVKFVSNVESGKQTVQMDKLFDLLRALSLHVYVSDTPLKQDKESGSAFSFLG